MRDLRLTDKNKAIGIKLYCRGCKAEFHTSDRNEWGPIIRKGVEVDCDHLSERIVYKAIYVIPKTRNDRRCKQLDTRSTTEANKLALKFKTELVENNWGRDEKKEAKEVRSNFLLDVMALYIDYLHNIEVPFHKQKIREEGSIKDVERTFRYFMEFLKKKRKRKPRNFQITSIDDDLVGDFIKYLQIDCGYGGKYISKHVSSMHSLFKYLIEKKKYPIDNFFEDIVIKKPKGKKRPLSITKEKLNALLKIIEEGDSHAEVGKESKRRYQKWLKDAFKLAVHLGCRRKGIAMVKWSDINLYEDELLGGYIDMCDFKSTSKNEMATGDSEEYYPVPIYQELKELLLELGYETKKDSDAYILAPEWEHSRLSMENIMSKSFSHYFKQLNYEDNLQMGCLRKTYVSAMKRHFGANHHIFTGHSTGSVVDTYYFDSSVLVAEVKTFKLFG